VNQKVLERNKFALLFVSVLLIVLVMPLMSGKLLLIFPFVLIILMLGVFRTLSLPKLLMFGCAGIGVLAAILHFAAFFTGSPGGDSNYTKILTLGALSCYCIFLGTSILGLLSGILGRHEITRDTIRGSLSVYLLLGILFALLYRIVYILKPSEFAASIAPGLFPEFLYFSFTTLTTLGYGDISPLGPISRSLTTLETIAGPVYLTVLVSKLVGHTVSRSNEEE
jgi:hypothetical protein